MAHGAGTIPNCLYRVPLYDIFFWYIMCFVFKNHFFSMFFVFCLVFVSVWLFHQPVGYSLIYPTTWISRLKTRLVTVHA